MCQNQPAVSGWVNDQQVPCSIPAAISGDRHGLSEVGSAGLEAAIGVDGACAIDAKDAHVIVLTHMPDDDVATCAIQEITSRSVRAIGLSKNCYGGPCGSQCVSPSTVRKTAGCGRNPDNPHLPSRLFAGRSPLRRFLPGRRSNPARRSDHPVRLRQFHWGYRPRRSGRLCCLSKNLPLSKLRPQVFEAVLSAQIAIGGYPPEPSVLGLKTCKGQAGLVVPIPMLPSGA